MSCPHDCDDGWIVDEATRTATSCACRAPAAKTRAAQALAARRYAKARRAGKASGRARAQRRPSRARRGGDRCRAGHSAYYVRDVSRVEFHRRYETMCTAQDLVWSLRGENTAWVLYDVERRSWHAQGQDFETTNGQRQTALQTRGRARCRRTVQYTRKRLEAMGLIRYFHIRRGGATPGEKDTLLVRMLRQRPGRSRASANCTPPFGEAGNRFVPHRGSLPSTALSAPAAPADDDPAPPGGPASPAGTERGTAGQAQALADAADELIAPPLEDERIAQARFDELKRQAGWKVPRRPWQRHRRDDQPADVHRLPWRRPDGGERA